MKQYNEQYNNNNTVIKDSTQHNVMHNTTIVKMKMTIIQTTIQTIMIQIITTTPMPHRDKNPSGKNPNVKRIERCYVLRLLYQPIRVEAAM